MELSCSGSPAYFETSVTGSAKACSHFVSCCVQSTRCHPPRLFCQDCDYLDGSQKIFFGGSRHIQALHLSRSPGSHSEQGRSQDLVSGGGTHFGGGRPPIFRLRPQITRVPPYVLLATSGFRGGGRPRPPPPPLATPLTLSHNLRFVPYRSNLIPPVFYQPKRSQFVRDGCGRSDRSP